MSYAKSGFPPRKLIALILGITAIPLVSLLLLGQHLLEKDRSLEKQQAQQRLDGAADRVVAALQRAVSSSAQRLGTGTGEWAEGAVAVTFSNGQIIANPRERVAYLAVVPPYREPPLDAFAVGDAMYFQKQDHLSAVHIFEEMARSNDSAVRAGALLRLGNNLAHVGRTKEALETYAQLARIDDIRISGAPAGLIGLYLRCDLLEKENRKDDLRAEAQILADGLLSVRWLLIKSVYGAYLGDTERWVPQSQNALRQAEIFANAIGVLWERPRSTAPASGQESISIDSVPLAVLWQTEGGVYRALVAAPEFVKSQWVAPAEAAMRDQKVSFTLGEALAEAGVPAATRKAADTTLPWDVVTVSLDPTGADRGLMMRRRLLIAGFILLASMTLAAGYMIFRALHREFAVARLQSDFVAAVSHEFRTPLTALLQFTTMLREQPQLNEEGRQVCYDVQSRATVRLMRLVESLLDFGRMEAGVRRYHFEHRDCAELVRSTVDEFQADTQTTGHAIEFQGDGPVQIEADTEALSRALRNLLDNAVKYSPGQDRIKVKLERHNGHVHIAVHDHGIGIPAHERGGIFAKFQRGEGAQTRGIRGTGIGLAMVDEIVKAHHGHVEVESEPGKGSTFTIVLPVKN